MRILDTVDYHRSCHSSPNENYDLFVDGKDNASAHLSGKPFSVIVWRVKPMGRTTSRANLGVVPVQKRRMPSSVKIRYAQWNELRYCARASSDCMRVLITLVNEKNICDCYAAA